MTNLTDSTFKPRNFPALFGISLCVFIYQILIIRLFAVLYLFDTLFIIISLSILGGGLGGIFLHWRLKLSKDNSEKLSPLSLKALTVLPLSYLASVVYISRWFYKLGLTANIIISLVPFFLSGIVIADIFRTNSRESGKLYFFDLGGGAAGCLLSIVLTQWLGVIYALMSLAVISSLLIFPVERYSLKKLIIPFISLLFVAGSFFIAPLEIGPEQIKRTDTILGQMLNYKRFKAKWHRSTWDIYSRCDLVSGNKDDSLRDIFINGGTQASMVRYDPQSLGVLRQNIIFFPYLFGKNRDIAIIGSGGGRDILMSLLAGAESVDAVEINEGVVKMTEQEAAFNGNIYHRPKVNRIVEDGRTFIMKGNKLYDRIVLTLSSTNAFSDVNGIAQMENYLYTKEAFAHYMRRLKPEGTLTIFLNFSQVLEKFIMAAIDYFEGQGLTPPQGMHHVAAVSSSGWSAYSYALMVGKKAFSLEEADRIVAKTKEFGAGIVFIPHYESDTRIYQVAFGKITPSQYIKDRKLNLKPSTDNSPYFLEVVINHRIKLYYLLGAVLLLIFLNSLVYLFYTRQPPNGSWKNNLSNLGYFFALGWGFMALELFFTKRFSFYLGFPHLNLAVILCSILAGSGSGAFFSQKMGWEKSISFICVLIAAWGIFVNLTVAHYINLTIDNSLNVRVLTAVLYLFPGAFLMGMPFPLALRRLGRQQSEKIPWFWGINGLASVAGSTATVAIGMAWGLDKAVYLAVLLYSAAAILSSNLPSTD